MILSLLLILFQLFILFQYIPFYSSATRKRLIFLL
nr:MAG TPA: hypothetical protein [Caudoviricetes sp.]